MGLFGRLFRRPDGGDGDGARRPVDRGADRFAAEVLRRLRAAGIRDARYHRDEFAIAYRPGGDRDPAWMYLANLYAECRRDPRGRANRIDRFVAAFVELPAMPETWSQAQPLVRPVLRGASFGRGGAARHRAVLRRPVLPYLDELVVVDQPTSMGYITEGLWDVPPELVFSAARANLADDPPRLPDSPDGGPAVLRFYDAGDSYFVSRLLVNGWLASLGERVGGRPVAFAPEPSSLVVAADEPRILDEVFTTMAAEYAKAPRALSPMGYTLDEHGRLVPYSVPRGHPLFDTVARAERTLAAVEYETQCTVLRSSSPDEPYFAASCLLANRPDGTAFTVASWSRDLPTLLPVVDYVAFTVDGAEPFFVPWQVLLDEDLLIEAIEYRPARYRADAWPGREQLRALAGRAVSL